MQFLLSIPHQPNIEPQIFGYIAYVDHHKSQRSKLDPCARMCFFIEYFDFQEGYRCYDPQTNTIHVPLNVSIHESEPYYLGRASISSLHGENYNEENILNGNNPVVNLEFVKG